MLTLVHHDDATREYAYGPDGGLPETRVGTFSGALMAEATRNDWVLISMKDDRKRVFAFDKYADLSTRFAAPRLAGSSKWGHR